VVDDDATEPPVPPGLATPPALGALAAFLRVDADLPTAAGEGANVIAVSPAALRRWVAALPAAETPTEDRAGRRVVVHRLHGFLLLLGSSICVICVICGSCRSEGSTLHRHLGLERRTVAA